MALPALPLAVVGSAVGTVMAAVVMMAAAAAAAAAVVVVVMVGFLKLLVGMARVTQPRRLPPPVYQRQEDPVDIERPCSAREIKTENVLGG